MEVGPTPSTIRGHEITAAMALSLRLRVKLFPLCMHPIVDHALFNGEDFLSEAALACICSVSTRSA